MKTSPRWYDYISINIYFLGLLTLVQTIGLISPLLVQKFVGETIKATYFGTLRLWSLMAALLTQSAAGIISDHSRIRWGRRRPFILLGTFFDLIFLALILITAKAEGVRGFWMFFSLIIFLQISSNIAQAAQQGLIPDLVSPELRGRFSGIKVLFEIPFPLLFVSLVIARVISHGDMYLGILIAASILFASMVITMLVREQSPPVQLTPMNWRPFVRLFSMTIFSTALILGFGEFIQSLGALLPKCHQPITSAAIIGILGFLTIGILVFIGVLGSLRISLGNSINIHSNYLWWVINRLSYLIGATNLSSFAIYFLQARLGLVREEAAQPASILMLIIGISILISSPLSGWLSDYVGYKRLLLVCGVLAFFGAFLAILKPDLILIYLGGILVGVATGIFYAANWALGTKLIPPNEAGKYLGIANLAGAGAGAIGAYIGGPIADMLNQRFPTTPEIGYCVIFAIYGSLFLFSSFASIHINTG